MHRLVSRFASLLGSVLLFVVVAGRAEEVPQRDGSSDKIQHFSMRDSSKNQAVVWIPPDANDKPEDQLARAEAYMSWLRGSESLPSEATHLLGFDGRQPKYADMDNFRAEIDSALGRLDPSGPTNLVLVLASHSYVSEDGFEFCTDGNRSVNGRALAATIKSALVQHPNLHGSLHLTVLINTCFAGRGLSEIKASGIKELVKVTVIASATENALSYNGWLVDRIQWASRVLDLLEYRGLRAFPQCTHLEAIANLVERFPLHLEGANVRGKAMVWHSDESLAKWTLNDLLTIGLAFNDYEIHGEEILMADYVFALKEQLAHTPDIDIWARISKFPRLSGKARILFSLVTGHLVPDFEVSRHKDLAEAIRNSGIDHCYQYFLTDNEIANSPLTGTLRGPKALSTLQKLKAWFP